MSLSKIIDEAELQKWFREGRTYAWMEDMYWRKYHVRVSRSTFANHRRRLGFEPRLVRDEALIPWTVRVEHRYLNPALMLRAEGRVRARKPLPERTARLHRSWREMLAREDLVVHYDPDTTEGWFYVPRDETDVDIIRQPGERARAR